MSFILKFPNIVNFFIDQLSGCNCVYFCIFVLVSVVCDFLLLILFNGISTYLYNIYIKSYINFGFITQLFSLENDLAWYFEQFVYPMLQRTWLKNSKYWCKIFTFIMVQLFTYSSNFIIFEAKHFICILKRCVPVVVVCACTIMRRKTRISG